MTAPNRRQAIKRTLKAKMVGGPTGKPSVGSGTPTGPKYGGNMRLGLGQLQKKAASGKISGTQMANVAGQRQLLANKFGPDWRDKIFQGGPSFKGMNREISFLRQAQAHAGESPSDPQPNPAKLAALIAKRKAALDRRRQLLNQITPGRPR